VTPQETVDEFIHRICSGDIAGACDLTTPDVVYHNVPMSPTVGRDGMREVLEMLAGMIDETEWVVHHTASTGNVVLNERADRFRKGDLWVELAVAGVFEVNDGRISVWRDYFDMTQFNDSFAVLVAASHHHEAETS
jgi:limonene-1,2-epoxide hydrolase